LNNLAAYQDDAQNGIELSPSLQTSVFVLFGTHQYDEEAMELSEFVTIDNTFGTL
jgi:hypothetical protein